MCTRQFDRHTAHLLVSMIVQSNGQYHQALCVSVSRCWQTTSVSSQETSLLAGWAKAHMFQACWAGTLAAYTEQSQQLLPSGTVQGKSAEVTAQPQHVHLASKGSCTTLFVSSCI